MATEAVITLIVVASFFVTVLTGKLTIDIALAASMVVLLVLGVLTPVEALQGFANPAIYIIALLLYRFRCD
jgi:di/tricarboxylate transporter